MQKYFISFISNDKRCNALLTLIFDFLKKKQNSKIPVKLNKYWAFNNGFVNLICSKNS